MLPKLCVALDDPEPAVLSKLLACLDPEQCWLKVGSTLFTAYGPKLIKDLRRQGFAIFLDLKFHDIPNTVAKAVTAAIKLDVAMLTVHAAGGPAMLQAAATAAAAAKKPLQVVAVTALTSMDQSSLQQTGVVCVPQQLVRTRAELAMDADCAGVVCSGKELSDLRANYPAAVLVCPGIRAHTDDTADQARTVTPSCALMHGADYLVVGRPITTAADPQRVLEDLILLCNKYDSLA